MMELLKRFEESNPEEAELEDDDEDGEELTVVRGLEGLDLGTESRPR